jgi:hypothetical protein
VACQVASGPIFRTPPVTVYYGRRANSLRSRGEAYRTLRAPQTYGSITTSQIRSEVGKTCRSYCNGTVAASTAPRQSCKGFFFLPPEMRPWQSRTRRGLKDKGEGTCSNGANCVVLSMAWPIHTLLLLPFHGEKRRVEGLWTGPPVRAGGDHISRSFACAESSSITRACVRSSLHRSKAARLIKSGVHDRHSLSIFRMRGTVSVSPCGCWRLWL